MPYYIPDLVSKTTCIGNTLSTFNVSFSTLDTKLYELSTYTVNSVNYLSSTMISVSSVLNSRINFLSSAMISVSSDLRTQIFTTSSSLVNQINLASSFSTTQEQFLSSSVDFVSANVVNDYITQGVLTNNNGQIDWNFSTVGNNASIELSSSASLNNPTGLLAGQSGNLLLKIMTDGSTLTGFGDKWTFVEGNSALFALSGIKNLLSYYYDGEDLLSNIIYF
jgi:hypothetical protein